MTREKLKKWCCYYLLLWLGAFICIGVTQLTGLSIRPIVEFYDEYGATDDYEYQLTSNIALKYYKEHGLSWDYKYVGNYAGNIWFILHEDDDLEQYAYDVAAMIAEALKDPFYKDNVGGISIEIIDNGWNTLYFGDYQPFMKSDFTPDYYTAPQNVLAELRKWMGIYPALT